MRKELYLFVTLITGFFLIFLSCQQAGDNNSDEPIDTLTENEDVPTDNEDKQIMIYYSVPSPLEMATLMSRTNSSFYSDLLSPVESIEKHTTNASLALNIGVYGVDLSYAKIFNQEQIWQNYLGSLKRMSEKLGIPQNQTASIYGSIEDHIENSDTLLKIINDTYITTNAYLRENNRENIATLIVLGGWIEALYIATNIYSREADSEDILHRIAVQKLSLNYLIQEVSKNQDDEIISEFLVGLLKLKRTYDKIEIKYDKDKVKKDTINKVMIVRSDEPLYVDKKHIADITRIIKEIRKSILK